MNIVAWGKRSAALGTRLRSRRWAEDAENSPINLLASGPVITRFHIDHQRDSQRVGLGHFFDY